MGDAVSVWIVPDGVSRGSAEAFLTDSAAGRSRFLRHDDPLRDLAPVELYLAMADRETAVAKWARLVGDRRRVLAIQHAKPPSEDYRPVGAYDRQLGLRR